MRVLRASLVVAAAVLVSSPAVAVFRAADFVVVPVASSTTGLSSSVWHSDLEIMNVSSDTIDVQVVLLPSGGGANVEWYTDIKNVLGGRAEDGFGHVDTKLKDIPAGRAVVLEDVVTATWGDGLKGALLIWGYKAGTLLTTTPPGGEPRNIVASSRVYAVATNVDAKQLTYGQHVPGLPWYYYIDPNKKTAKLDHVVFTGIREDASYRSSLGLVNISDQLTYVTITMTLKKEDGTVVDELIEYLEPLAHVQYDQFFYSAFGRASTETIANATLTISASSWSSTSATPTPAVMAYVSRIDNLTNDGINKEQVFEPEMPWDCVFNGVGCPTPAPTPSASSRLGQARQVALQRHLPPPVPGRASRSL